MPEHRSFLQSPDLRLIYDFEYAIRYRSNSGKIYGRRRPDDRQLLGEFLCCLWIYRLPLACRASAPCSAGRVLSVGDWIFVPQSFDTWMRSFQADVYQHPLCRRHSSRNLSFGTCEAVGRIQSVYSDFKECRSHCRQRFPLGICRAYGCFSRDNGRWPSACGPAI